MKSFARPGSTNIVNNVSEGEVEDIGLPEFNNSGKQRQGGRWVWIYCEKKGFKKRQKNREKQTHHSTQCARMDLNEEFLSQRLLHHERDCKKVQNHQ